MRRWELQLESQELELTRREKSLLAQKEEIDYLESRVNTSSSESALQIRIRELEYELEAVKMRNSPEGVISKTDEFGVLLGGGRQEPATNVLSLTIFQCITLQSLKSPILYR